MLRLACVVGEPSRLCLHFIFIRRALHRLLVPQVKMHPNPFQLPRILPEGDFLFSLRYWEISYQSAHCTTELLPYAL